MGLHDVDHAFCKPVVKQWMLGRSVRNHCRQQTCRPAKALGSLAEVRATTVMGYILPGVSVAANRGIKDPSLGDMISLTHCGRNAPLPDLATSSAILIKAAAREGASMKDIAGELGRIPASMRLVTKALAGVLADRRNRLSAAPDRRAPASEQRRLAVSFSYLDMTADPVTIKVDNTHSVGPAANAGARLRLLCPGPWRRAGMADRFMVAVADGLAARDVATLRYQFPYMEAGSKRPDRPALAHATVRAAVAAASWLAPGLPSFAGGK